MSEPVWTSRIGCSGCLVIIIFASLTVAFFMLALFLVVGFFITYAVVSVIANAIVGPDPEPSPSFWTRLTESD
jgi:hypothetical protein